MTPPPDPRKPDALYDLVRLFWRAFRGLSVELERWAWRHYRQGFRQDDVQEG